MAISYKCATVGCYSYNSPETDALFKRLQTLVNQFASAAAIEPIEVDGVIGKGTTETTLYVLQVLGEADKGVVGASCLSIADSIYTPEQLAVNAQVVVDVLTLATKQPALAAQPPAPIPVAVPTPSLSVIATSSANAPTKPTSPAAEAKLATVVAAKPQLKRSLLERIPPWGAYAGGAALALTALGIALSVAKKRRGGSRMPSASPAVAGRW